MKITLDAGHVRIEMSNCTVSGFKGFLDSSGLEHSPSVSIRLSNCGVVDCPEPFRVSAPQSTVFQLLLQSCYFTKCVRALSLGGAFHRVKVVDCEFAYNKLCVQLGASAGAAQKPRESLWEQIAFEDSFFRGKSADSVLISECNFTYNESVLLAKGFSSGLRFSGNKVKYCLCRGILCEQCPKALLSGNSFELNFDRKLFQNDEVPANESQSIFQSAKGDSQKRDTKSKKAVLEAVLKMEKVLVELRDSCAQVSENRFSNNCGTLVKVAGQPRPEQRAARFETEKNKKEGRFKAEPRLDVGNLLQSDAPEPRFDRKGSPSVYKSVRKTGSGSRKSSQYKLEDSTVNLLTFDRVKKKIPVLKIFKRRSHRKRFQAPRRSKECTQSYLQAEPEHPSRLALRKK